MRDKFFMIPFKQVAGLISVITLIAPTPAQAQTWMFVGENEGSDLCFPRVARTLLNFGCSRIT